MATLSHQKATNCKIVKFKGADGQYHSIRLGKMDVRTAVKLKTKIEQLSIARLGGVPLEAETVEWLAKIGK